MILYKNFSVVSDYLPNLTSDRQILHTQSQLHVHVPEYGTTVEYMYLVVAFSRLGTTFCVNFE